jgi:hypothetical protein
MGTITRTFANNITTSGVFKPTAFNDASFDNVTAVPSGAVEGGNMVLLSTQTASASASISFTSGIDSTYKEYMFIFNNIHGSAASDFQMNFSTDGGSSYAVTKTTTALSAYHSESDASAMFIILLLETKHKATDFIYLTGDNMEANDLIASVSGYLHFLNHHLLHSLNILFLTQTTMLMVHINKTIILLDMEIQLLP